MTPVARIACVLVLIATSCLAKEVKGKTYAFTIPDDATFEFQEAMESYTFKWGDGAAFGMMMLFPMQGGISEGMAKPMLDLMAASLEDQLKKQGQFTNISKRKRDVKTGPFTGAEIEFTMTHGGGVKLWQSMLVLWDGQQAWTANLTGSSADHIATAHKILGTATPIK